MLRVVVKQGGHTLPPQGKSEVRQEQVAGSSCCRKVTRRKRCTPGVSQLLGSCQDLNRAIRIAQPLELDPCQEDKRCYIITENSSGTEKRRAWRSGESPRVVRFSPSSPGLPTSDAYTHAPSSLRLFFLSQSHIYDYINKYTQTHVYTYTHKNKHTHDYIIRNTSAHRSGFIHTHIWRHDTRSCTHTYRNQITTDILVHTCKHLWKWEQHLKQERWELL